MFADIGGGSADGVVGASLTYDSVNDNGDYSFSLVNKLREPVRNVYCLIVFYDKAGTPLDVQVIHSSDVIPDGLAKRITGRVHPSVRHLNGGTIVEGSPWKAPPYLPRNKDTVVKIL